MAIRLNKAGKIRLHSGNMGLTKSLLVAGTGVTLTDVSDQRVYQRVGTSKSVTITGTYTGSPTRIQARVVDASTSAQVVAWTTIANNPTGGTFSGSLSVPQGGWYKLQVRDGVNTALVSNGSNRFGVGAVIGMIGQSNMANMPSTVYHYPLGDPQAVEYSGTAFVRVGNITSGTYYAPNTESATYGSNFTGGTNRGDGHVYFANLMAEGLGVPVCVVNKAVIGSAISSWQSGQTNWTNFASAITAIGGDMEMVIWHQGETDAAAMSGATYKTNMGNVHTQCKALTGRSDSTFKFGVVSLGAGSYNSSLEGDFGKLRVAQVQYGTGTTGAFLAGCAYDAATTDGVHISGEGFNRMGRRYAKAALYQYGVGTSGAGPKISSATRSGTTITVNITHAGGTALTDGAGGSGTALTGFKVYDNGVAMTISGTTISGNTVLLTLSSTPTGTVTLEHAIMNVPSGSSATVFTPAGTVYDNATYYNSTLGCPLQPCAAITVT